MSRSENLSSSSPNAVKLTLLLGILCANEFLCGCIGQRTNCTIYSRLRWHPQRSPKRAGVSDQAGTDHQSCRHHDGPTAPQCNACSRCSRRSHCISQAAGTRSGIIAMESVRFDGIETDDIVADVGKRSVSSVTVLGCPFVQTLRLQLQDVGDGATNPGEMDGIYVRNCPMLRLACFPEVPGWFAGLRRLVIAGTSLEYLPAEQFVSLPALV